MMKLTRKAQILIFILVLCIFFGVGFFLLRDTKEEEKPQEKVQYEIALVAENQKITSTYIDSISSSHSSNIYKEYAVTLKKGTKVAGYALSQDQSFSKYLKLVGPNGQDVLTKKSNQKITHYAYSMLLTGDVLEKTNTKTREKTYEIINARVTYDQVPLVLLSNENSVCLRNEKKNNEKIVKLQDFIDALKDVKKRETMISW